MTKQAMPAVFSTHLESSIMNPVNTLVGRRLLNLVFFMLIPALAQATTYYVSIYGSDSNSCDEAQSP